MILNNATEQSKCMKLIKENVYKEINKNHVNRYIY